MYKLCLKVIFITFVSSIIITIDVYAGELLDIDNHRMYKTSDGTFAKNIFVWIDDNNDNIEEIYRFDENGYIAINYTHDEHKKTNNKGQVLVDGKIAQRYKATKTLLNVESDFIGPKLPQVDNSRYLYNGKVISPNISEQARLKIKYEDTIGSETLQYEEINNNGLINNIKKEYDPMSDVVAETGIIYGKGVGVSVDTSSLEEGEKIIAGKDGINFISTSTKFRKKVEEAKIYNGTTWKNCMALDGNKSKVKFTLNKNNYVYMEVSNEYHEIKNLNIDATLSIYADNTLIDTIDDFTNLDEPYIIEEDLENKKTLEIRLSIESGNLSESVFIRNLKFRKIKDDD